ncbi:MAG: hypothetical protein ACTSQJ_20045, partial [Promethearchaeota archaeon]
MREKKLKTLFKRAFQSKLIDKTLYINFLKSIIEENNDAHLRAKSINFLRKLKVNTQDFFSLLENVLVSDISLNVRISAIKALIEIFPLKCINPIKWAFFHDDYDFIRK